MSEFTLEDIARIMDHPGGQLDDKTKVLINRAISLAPYYPDNEAILKHIEENHR